MGISVDGNIAVISLNRPGKRNAISPGITQAIDHLVRRIDKDDQLRVAILTSSSGGFFCAGADLQIISEGRNDELNTKDGGFAGSIDARRVKPWIATVTGPVLAGGLELCLAYDMIVASDTAKFGLPEVKRELFAAGAGAHRLARVLPRNIAIELVATDDPIEAEQAFALGLINRLVSAEAVLAEAVSLARAIAVNAPLSVRESLRVARVADEQPDAALREMSTEIADRIFASDDAREGAVAFLEKRLPNRSGR